MNRVVRIPGAIAEASSEESSDDDKAFVRRKVFKNGTPKFQKELKQKNAINSKFRKKFHKDQASRSARKQATGAPKKRGKGYLQPMHVHTSKELGLQKLNRQSCEVSLKSILDKNASRWQVDLDAFEETVGTSLNVPQNQ